jgi:putative Mg2+ transporter-C (MgtC) family protein
MMIFAILLNLIFAAIAGTIIGLERKFKRKSVGIKTMILISVGSALFTMTAMLLPGVDPLRVTSQIVTGIGFLGAGVIIRSGDRISGLTTAALVWVSSALGVLSGFGYGVEAIGVSMFITSLTIIVSMLEARLFKKVDDGKREEKV